MTWTAGLQPSRPQDQVAAVTPDFGWISSGWPMGKIETLNHTVQA